MARILNDLRRFVGASVAKLCVLISFLAVLPSAAHAQYCEDTFTFSRDRDDPRGTCVEYTVVTLTTAGRTTRIHIMYDRPEGVATSVPPSMPTIATAMRDTANAVGPLLSSSLAGINLPPTIHVVVVGQLHSGGRNTYMRTIPQTYLQPGRQRDCPLIVYDGGATLTAGQLRRTFAHELFHCAQYETYYDQTRDDSSKWWREGSAEWFEDLAFPALVGDSDLDRVIRLFADRARDGEPMHEAEYSNAVFFAWLHARGRVVRYLDQMVGSGASQTAAMRRALPAEDYRQFAQDYFDAGIAFPSGRIARGDFGPSYAGLQTTGEPERDPDLERRPRKAFAIFQDKAAFVPGEYSPDGKVGTDDKVFSEAPGRWEPLPRRLVVRCGEKKEYRVVTMPVEDTPPPLKIKPGTTKAMQCGECGATGGGVRRAGCVVGSWRMVSGGNCDMLGGLGGSFGANVSVLACNPGTATATFNRDGTFGGMLQNASRSVEVALPAGRREQPRLQMNNLISLAKSAGLWKATEETGALELCSTSTVGSGHVEIVGSPRGPQPMRFGPAAYVQLQYTCAGDSMTITVPARAPMPGFSVQLERTATPP